MIGHYSDANEYIFNFVEQSLYGIGYVLLEVSWRFALGYGLQGKQCDNG